MTRQEFCGFCESIICTLCLFESLFTKNFSLGKEETKWACFHLAWYSVIFIYLYKVKVLNVRSSTLRLESESFKLM